MPRGYWHTFIAAGLGAIFFAGLGYFAGSLQTGSRADQQHNRAKEADAARQADDGAPPISERAVIRFVPPPNHAQAYPSEEARSDADLIAQRWMAWASVGMFAVSALGVFLIYLTLRETKGVLKEAEDATKVAQSTVNVTRDIGARQSRAYLQADRFQLRGFLPGRVPEFEFRVKNFGQTPATQIECFVSMGYFASDDEDKRFSMNQHMPSEGAFFLAPGNDMASKLPFGEAIDKRFRDDIGYDVISQYFYGYIRYCDVFGVRRRLVFCVKIRPDSLTMDGEASLIKAERHNHAN